MRHSVLTFSAVAALCATAAQADVTIDQTVVYGDELADESYPFFGDPFSGTQSRGLDIIDGRNALIGPDFEADIVFNSQGDEASLFIDSRFFLGVDDTYDSILQIGGFAFDSNNAPVFFNEGDTVDETSGTFSTSNVELFGTGPDADFAIPNVGDTGIFGFVVDIVGLTEPVSEEQPIFEGFCEELVQDCEQETIATFYGWVQVTHGSIQPGYIGINPFGQGALVSIPGTPPVVPLPAAGWMLLAGIGGLVAMRRRARVS